MTKNIVLTGVGGQGTVLASKLIAAAAMAKGLEVKSAETIGMAQRGGSVFSHLRIGDSVDCPMIAYGEADIILGFEPGETVRMLPYLKKDGFVVVSDRAVTPVTASLTGGNYDSKAMLDYLSNKVDNIKIIDTDKALSDLGSAKVLNVLLLGAAVRSGELGITPEEMIETIKTKVPPKFLDLNLKAFDYTSEAGRR